MTGSRAAFVMIPLMLFAYYLLRRGALGVLWAGLMMMGLFAVMLAISGIDLTGLTQMETELTQGYATGQAGEIADALRLTWVGRGVGTSTGAARVAKDDPTEFVGFEGYYAKAVAELGISGCAIVIGLQVALLLSALRTRGQLAETAARPYSDAIAACILLFLIYSYKGPVLHLDPGYASTGCSLACCFRCLKPKR